MDENVVNVLLDINKAIGEMTGKLQSALDKLVEHEGRITKLETGGSHFKDDILKLLAKTLLIAVASIASLTGAASLIKQIISN